MSELTDTLDVVDMTTAEAEAVTAEIRAGLVLVWEKVTVAYQRRAWVALGYDAWDDYCTGEFGAARVRIPREERHEVMSSLRDEGLSLRAIAAATGTSQQTVRRGLSTVPNRHSSPPAPDGIGPDLVRVPSITGINGKTYTRAEVLDAKVGGNSPARRRPPHPDTVSPARPDRCRADPATDHPPPRSPTQRATPTHTTELWTSDGLLSNLAVEWTAASSTSKARATARSWASAATELQGYSHAGQVLDDIDDIDAGAAEDKDAKLGALIRLTHAGAFLTTLHRYPIDRRPTGIAGNLALDTLHASPMTGGAR